MKGESKSALRVVVIMLVISVAQFSISVYSTYEQQVEPPPEAIQLTPVSTNGSIAINETWMYQPPEPGFSAHWWKGTVCPWAMGTTEYLTTYIKTPDGEPGDDEFYYVLLSCFDDAGSYNQIGFSAYNGHWGLTWSWTTHDFWGNLYYHYDASAITLDEDTTYQFEMYLDDGDLTYNLVVGGYTEWTKTVETGGSEFQLTNIWHVGSWPFSGWYTCFTLYEEVYDTDAKTPDFNFKFQSTQTLEGYWDDWDVYSAGSPPSGIGVTISETYHYVYITNPDAP